MLSISLFMVVINCIVMLVQGFGYEQVAKRIANIRLTEESSRCDHGNVNQYAYLCLQSRIWGV